MLALNHELYHMPKPAPKRHEPKPMPFRARDRHQYWSVDIRYLDHKLGGGNIYAITILENYSRAVLASAISRTQALTAYLIVLFAAIRMHGSPEGLVSDGGSVFKAKQAQVVVALLDCHPTTQEFTCEESPRSSQSGEQNATARARRGATPRYPAAHRRDL
jgi:transposase InsO family protein